MRVLSLLIAICSIAVSQTITVKIDSVCKGFSNAHQCAKSVEAYQIKKYPNRLKRVDEKLFVKLQSGEFKQITNVNGSPNFYEYYFSIGYYLIRVQYQEGNTFILIDEKTGRFFQIHEIPLFTEDFTRFITTSFDLESRYNPNAIQIWKLTDKGLVLEFDFHTLDWGPSDATWLNHNHVGIIKNVPNWEDLTFSEKKENLVFANGQWAIKGE